MSDRRKPPVLKGLFVRLLRHSVIGPLVQRLGGSMLRYMPGQITCQRFEAFLYDYSEDRLTAPQRSLFERHMKVCPMCRTSLDSYLKVVEMGQTVCARDEQDQIFTAAPQELIDAIIEVSKKAQ